MQEVVGSIPIGSIWHPAFSGVLFFRARDQPIRIGADRVQVSEVSFLFCEVERPSSSRSREQQS